MGNRGFLKIRHDGSVPEVQVDRTKEGKGGALPSNFPNVLDQRSQITPRGGKGIEKNSRKQWQSDSSVHWCPGKGKQRALKKERSDKWIKPQPGGGKGVGSLLKIGQSPGKKET